MKTSSTPYRLTLGALALTLGACATGSSASSSTPVPAVVAPVIAAPAPVPAAPAPVVSAPAPALLPTTPTPAVVAASIDFDKQVKPFFDEYCIRCHGGTAGRRPSGGYNLANAVGLKRSAGTPDDSTIYDVLTDVPHMPPRGQPQPTADDIAMIKQWIVEGAKISASYPTGS